MATEEQRADAARRIEEAAGAVAAAAEAVEAAGLTSSTTSALDQVDTLDSLDDVKPLPPVRSPGDMRELERGIQADIARGDLAGALHSFRGLLGGFLGLV